MNGYFTAENTSFLILSWNAFLTFLENYFGVGPNYDNHFSRYK